MGLFGKLFGNPNADKNRFSELKQAFSEQVDSDGVFDVMAVFNIKGVGIVVAGEIKNGTLLVGAKMNVNGKTGTVVSIEEHHVRLQSAHTGQKVGVNLSGIEKNDCKPGDKLSF